MQEKLILHFIKTDTELDEEIIKRLKNAISEHAINACNVLDLNLVNIIVWPNQNAVIPETGEGGESWSKELCFIYIDPTRSNNDLREIIEKNIPATVYHELNHVARELFLGKSGIGFHTDLNKALISEGMASIFAEEMFPTAKSPWTNYSNEEIQSLMDIYRNRDVSCDKNYNHGDWFYGEGELSRWIGYKVGCYLVRNFRQKEKNISWKELIAMDAEKVIEKVEH